MLDLYSRKWKFLVGEPQLLKLEKRRLKKFKFWQDSNRNSRILVGCCFLVRYKTAVKYCKFWTVICSREGIWSKSKSDKRSQLTIIVTHNHNHFKATLCFRGSTSTTRCIVTASLLTNKVISIKQMYINMSNLGRCVKSGTWLKV